MEAGAPQRHLYEGVGVRNSDQVLDLRLRNATAQTCQHLLGATDAGIRASVPLPWRGLPLRAWEPPAT